MRRRHSPPPFEIMTGLTSASSHPAPATSDAPPSPSRGPMDWWERAKYPVVLRVPRGYVALAVVSLIAVLIAAYMAGQSRGLKQGVAQTRAEYEQTRTVSRHVVIDNHAVAEEESSNPVQASVPAQPPPLYSQVGRDPRRVGLNYFVLASHDEAGARRLLAFLWDKGMEAAAFQQRPEGLYRVIALQGFRRSEVGGEEYRDYERSLQRLGAEWGRMPGGIDFLRLGMHAELYKGEKAAKIIVRDAQP